MTDIERAITELQEECTHEALVLGCDGKKQNCGNCYIKTSIEALEKQIPKKPNKGIDRSWGKEKEVDVCPVCDYYLSKIIFITTDTKKDCKKVSYCETCGQAILWEDEE